MNKPAKARAARRSPRSKAFSWWPYAIVAGILVAVAAFFVATHGTGSPQSSSSLGRTTGERGLPVGAVVPSQPLPSTAGSSISLDQMRGSKVVVYFYEGGG